MKGKGSRKVRRLLRYFVRAGGAAVMVIIIYGTLLAFPEPLFAHKYSYKNFVIYSRTPINDRIRLELDVVSQRLARSELNDPTIVHRVFVAGSSSWYAFFNGPYRSAMARNYEFNNSIFVPQLDLATRRIVHFDGRTAPIATILAHEMTHTLSQRRLGIIRSWRTRHRFTVDDLRVRVGVKENADPIPLCYCFGFDESHMRDEISTKGKTTIPARISGLVREGLCACESRNPAGVCCLGELNRAAKRLTGNQR